MSQLTKVSAFLLTCSISLFASHGLATETGDNPPYAKLAKAVIATIMGKNPSIISVTNYTDKNIFMTNYIRPSDNSKWSQIVKFDGNKAIWASAGTPTEPNKIGRWRDHPLDGVITFSIDGKTATIRERHPDGSTSEKTFNLSEL